MLYYNIDIKYDFRRFICFMVVAVFRYVLMKLDNGDAVITV